MRRYVDADKLQKDGWKLRRDRYGLTTSTYETMELDCVPTADVRENVRARWIPHPDPTVREWDICTACGIGCKRREFDIHANGNKWVTEYNFPFCPNCGAEMER